MRGADRDPLDLDRIPRLPPERGERVSARLLRMVLFALVCFGVVYGSWKNHERIIRDLNARSAVQAPEGALASQDRAFLLDFADSLRQRHGLIFRLAAAPGPLAPAEDNPRLLAVSLSTDRHEARVDFPPLLAKALAPGLAADLSARLGLALKQGDWPAELKESLILVWEGLSEPPRARTLQPNEHHPMTDPASCPDTVTISTDGSCLGNPGPGGWAAVLSARGKTRELSGGFKLTTNNRMELLAAIEALSTLTRPCQVVLRTDSKYVKEAITQRWLANWQRNGWMTAAKKPVKNQDLWVRLAEVLKKHQVGVPLGHGPRRGPGQRALRRAGQGRGHEAGAARGCGVQAVSGGRSVP